MTMNATMNTNSQTEQLSQLCAVGYYGNIFVRMHLLEKAGNKGQSHKHAFDHITFVTRGRVRVIVEDGGDFIVNEGGFFPVPKDQVHQVEALEDNSRIWCVFALRDEQGEVVDPDVAGAFYSGDDTASGRTVYHQP